MFKKYSNLILQMTLTGFKLKYYGSVLGYLWSLLKPLLFFAVLYLVFTLVFKLGKGVANYPIYLLVGIVMWTFFAEATLTGMNSIVGRGDLIRKVNFPKIIIVLSAVITALLTFILNLIVVAIFLIFSKIIPTITVVLFIPIFIEFAIFTLGVSFILATLYTKFRDFTHIWELAMQVLFYATPILYPISLVPVKYQKFIMLNPLAQIFQDARWSLISNNIATTWTITSLPFGLIPLIIVVVIFFVGLTFFQISAKNFAEEI